MLTWNKSAVAGVALAALMGTSARAGVFSEEPLVLSPASAADASTGVSSSKVYTHAFDIADAGGTVVNGVTFDGAQTSGGPYSGTGAAPGSGGGSFTLTGASTTAGPSGNDLDPASGAYDLTNDFYYSGGPGEAVGLQTLTLTGLPSSGGSYITRFYTAGYSGASQILDADDDGTANQYTTDRGDEKVISYAYTLPAGDTDIVFTFDAVNNSDAFHHYAFSNEIVPEPASLGLLGLGALALIARRRRA